MGEEKIRNTVPLLKGEVNFDVWRDGLRRYMNAADLDLWPVVTGVTSSPISEPLKVPTDDTIRNNIVTEQGVAPDAISDDDIRRWVKKNILEPNNELQWFRQKHAKALYLIGSSLDDSLLTFIYGLDDAVVAYNTICRIYGSINAHTFQAKWSAWVSCKYVPGGNPTTFLAKWQRALSELKKCLPDFNLHPPFQYAQFMEAIQANQNTENFLNKFKPKLTDSDLMETVFAEFTASESSRRRYAAVATAANV